MPHPHVIRARGVITERDYTPERAKAIEREVEVKAFAMVLQLGITRPTVRAKRWDLDTVCDLTEYPMYLLGPGAPRLETAADVLAHWPRARYEVVIDDQDYLDTLS